MQGESPGQKITLTPYRFHGGGFLLDRRRWTTRIELANAIFEYLKIFHNRQRRHTALHVLTRIEYKNTYYHNGTVTPLIQVN